MLAYTIEKHETSREWVVLLHGLGGNHTIFYKQKKDLAKSYNLLMIDFPGHGASKSIPNNTAELVAKEVIHVLDELKLQQVHIVAFSLGTIIANELLYLIPSRIKSLVKAGAIIQWSSWSGFLLKLAYKLRFLAPYMTFYKLFAFLMMPKSNHQRSRDIFIREAAKMGRKEFIKWAKLVTTPIKSYEKSIKNNNTIRKLYILGKEDHMFIQSATNAAERDQFSELELIENSGHVCIIEKPEQVNKLILSFLGEAPELEKERVS
ncbi:alpha/beta fold hydrolase [Ornithinibacillus halophilus]|uniref:Pimeloyl-ACP methyl ester carboxylesterase n=1 Tax=Ornithinibacillus halophilus TaxID=930117 RepID=A0A1M5KGT6_9BACI|nr:alpha/beta hydrolase [Ornithinibacillus halophilus]SHG52154.1 Pimeloyl-ACP methyl ester carboxylesterase [Ornithinibacillus halophilus]